MPRFKHIPGWGGGFESKRKVGKNGPRFRGVVSPMDTFSDVSSWLGKPVCHGPTFPRPHPPGVVVRQSPVSGTAFLRSTVFFLPFLNFASVAPPPWMANTATDQCKQVAERFFFTSQLVYM